MTKISGFLLSIFIAVSCASAQSGRRPAPAEPAPAPVADEPSLYSESKPTVKPHFYRRPVRSKDAKEERSAKAQAPAIVDQPSPEDDGEVVKVETDLVTIPVSVFDRNGLYIPNLRQSDFKIFEDGVEQQIAYFGTSEKPFTVVLLLDTSPSTEYKIEEIQQAAIAFVDQLKPQDKVMVIEFDANVHVLAEPTNDRSAVYKAIKKADFGGGTSLYDAVEFSLVKRLRAIDGRKAIVLFTDGVDTTSRKADYDSTLGLAEESEAMIFPIYYNTYLDNLTGGSVSIGLPLPGMRSVPGTTAKEYALGKKYLEDLSLMTGGRVFRPEATPGGLANAFAGIAEELRRQYNIGYIPNSERKRGERKNIKVRVDRPNLVLRARDSYIVQ